MSETKHRDDYPQVPPAEGGIELLRVTFARRWSLGILAAGVVFTTGATGVWLTRPSPPGTGTSLALGGVVLLGLLLVYGGGRQLLRPTRLLTITDRGLVIHLRDRRYRSGGRLIPWKWIDGFELASTEVWQGATRKNLRTLAIRLRDEAPDAPASISYGPSREPGCIHVDASSGTPSGHELLETVRTFSGRSDPLEGQNCRGEDEDKIPTVRG